MPFIALVFARDANAANRLTRTLDPEGYADNGGYKIVGLFRMPEMKKTPTCSGYCSAGGAYTRHQSGGWMMHACGKRHRDWRKRIFGSLFDVLGMNLLPRAITPKLFQNPDTWGN